MRGLGRRLTYANVVSTLALFIAVSGATAVAGGKIGTRGLKAGAVKTKILARNAVKPQKIARNAIRPRHINSNAVHSRHLAPGSVDGSKIAPGSIGAADVIGGARVVTTARGGPTAAPAEFGDEAPVALGNAGWIQGPSQNNLFLAEVLMTLASEPAATCTAVVEVGLDGSSIGTIDISTREEVPTLIRRGVMLDGARIASGSPRPAQLTATVADISFPTRCESARLDSLQLVVLGIG